MPWSPVQSCQDSERQGVLLHLQDDITQECSSLCVSTILEALYGMWQDIQPAWMTQWIRARGR